MNERIGKFKKKISVASARQRRVQGPASASFCTPSPLLSPLPAPFRSSPVSKGTCTCSASIRAQIHLRYSRSTSRILPSATRMRVCVSVRMCVCTHKSRNMISDCNPSCTMIITAAYIAHIIVYRCSAKSEHPERGAYLYRSLAPYFKDALWKFNVRI